MAMFAHKEARLGELEGTGYLFQNKDTIPATLQGVFFGGGGLQVALATLATLGLCMAFGVSWQAGLFTGFLVALSSTAIVLKMLSDRLEMDEEHDASSRISDLV